MIGVNQNCGNSTLFKLAKHLKAGQNTVNNDIYEEKNIRISEIFGPTIQGEGVLIGEPCIFVRTAGCDFRCSWCDSMHAVDSSFRNRWNLYSTNDIFNKIETLSKNSPLTIVLSGGNPAIQNLKPLINLGLKKDYKFTIETQGSLYKDWFRLLDTIVLSPKPPSSKTLNNWDIFTKCCTIKVNKLIIKIPILDEEDYVFAFNLAKKYPCIPIYLQPINDSPPTIDSLKHKNCESTVDLQRIKERFIWLVDRCIQDKWYNVRILPQLHVLIWGNKGGV